MDAILAGTQGVSGAGLVKYVRNGLFTDMETCASSAELSGAGLAERLAGGVILPVYGMPSRLRLLYHDFQGREALSIDRDLDLAITEFALGSQKTKDKRVYAAIGFTGPLLSAPALHPATDNPFPRRMWMARCDQCHYVNTYSTAPEMPGCPRPQDDANRRIAKVENGGGQLAGRASPCAGNCRLCFFRPS